MENCTLLASYSKHIDNGGVNIDIFQSNDKYKNIFIETATAYFDYPSTSSTLSIWDATEGKDILTKIGVTFIEAANKLS